MCHDYGSLRITHTYRLCCLLITTSLRVYKTLEEHVCSSSPSSSSLTTLEITVRGSSLYLGFDSQERLLNTSSSLRSSSLRSSSRSHAVHALADAAANPFFIDPSAPAVPDVETVIASLRLSYDEASVIAYNRLIDPTSHLGRFHTGIFGVRTFQPLFLNRFLSCPCISCSSPDYVCYPDVACLCSRCSLFCYVATRNPVADSVLLIPYRSRPPNVSPPHDRFRHYHLAHDERTTRYRRYRRVHPLQPQLTSELSRENALPRLAPHGAGRRRHHHATQGSHAPSQGPDPSRAGPSGAQ